MVDSCGWILAYMHVLAGKSCGGNDLVKQVHQGINCEGSYFERHSLEQQQKKENDRLPYCFFVIFP